MLLQRGLVHLYFGDGKGKTTAAIGLGLRACGRGKKVLLVQFLKDYDSGEIIALENFNDSFRILKGEPVKKFIRSMNADEKEKTMKNQHQMFKTAVQTICAESYDMIILDELVDAVNLEIVGMNEVEDFVKAKSENLEVVITGHNPKEDFFDLCDYITEIKKIKHPFDKGICARMGIEK
jgi:cob(I)alamin adenosyltransferase